tara:strand:- start:165 stop:338 length:174 start_codon:yes stop_codon:yes gene_type:complete
MAKKIPKDIANELYTAINRLEYATELLKMWVQYMDSDLTEAEEILVNKSKQFLGDKT